MQNILSPSRANSVCVWHTNEERSSRCSLACEIEMSDRENVGSCEEWQELLTGERFESDWWLMERRGPFYTTQDGSGTWEKGGTNVLEHIYRDRNVLVIAGTAGHKRDGLCCTCPPVNQTQAKIIAGGRGWGRGEGGMRKLLGITQCSISSENQAKKGAENSTICWN